MWHIKNTKIGRIMHTIYECNDNIYCAYMSMQINDVIIEVHFNCTLSTVMNDQNQENKFYAEYQKFTCKNIELFSEPHNAILNLNGHIKHAY